jgi:hypothetical protein
VIEFANQGFQVNVHNQTPFGGFAITYSDVVAELPTRVQ